MLWLALRCLSSFFARTDCTLSELHDYPTSISSAVVSLPSIPRRLHSIFQICIVRTRSHLLVKSPAIKLPTHSRLFGLRHRCFKLQLCSNKQTNLPTRSRRIRICHDTRNRSSSPFTSPCHPHLLTISTQSNSILRLSASSSASPL